MEMFGQSQNILEIEYFGENGVSSSENKMSLIFLFLLLSALSSSLQVGLGPTLEFYTLVSQQLQWRSLSLWFEDEHRDSTQQFMFNPGLFI
jgi:hypothetical protein